MNAIFIAGTDTGIGKTVITGLVSRYLLDKGYHVVTQKWIETGCSGLSDIDVHLKFMGKKQNEFKDYLGFMLPYAFKFASSPHLAARLQRKRIRISKIIRSLQALSKDFDFVLVEGTGGLLVPLDNRHSILDVVKKLKLPVVLVVGNKLGTINHTLLSIEILRQRGIKILGIIFNNISKNENKIILKDNPRIIKQLSRQIVFGILPRISNPYRLQERFNSIGDKMLATF